LALFDRARPVAISSMWGGAMPKGPRIMHELRSLQGAPNNSQ
jgi:hypothetical protein